MILLYNLFVALGVAFFKLLTPFNTKLSLFFSGRKNTFKILNNTLDERPVIWVHASSLGEFQQGRPILEMLKNTHQSCFFVLTFFSPSGYEIIKNKKNIADCIIYLPIDSKKNVQKFLNILNPQKVFFIKYDFWPNYLLELNRRGIETYLVSAIFRKNQLFFKWYGGFYKNLLYCFKTIFVQNNQSKELLKTIGINNVIISGDTRFDRVSKIPSKKIDLPLIEKFKGENYCILFGSIHKNEHSLFLSTINNLPKNWKVIIAPHNTTKTEIDSLTNNIWLPLKHYSKIQETDYLQEQVLIIDMVGILDKIYKFANLAFVGGGNKKGGLHNILEPAVFGVPIIIGNHYERFPEAVDLVNLGGVFSVKDNETFSQTIKTLLGKQKKREEAGNVCRSYIKTNKGATDCISKHLE